MERQKTEGITKSFHTANQEEKKNSTAVLKESQEQNILLDRVTVTPPYNERGVQALEFDSRDSPSGACSDRRSPVKYSSREQSYNQTEQIGNNRFSEQEFKQQKKLIEQLKYKLVQQTQENQFRQKQINELQQELEQIRRKLVEQIENERALEIQFDNIQNQLYQQTNWTQNLEQQLEQSQREFSQKIKKYQNSDQQITKKNEQISKLEQQIARQTHNLQLLKRQYAEEKKVIKELNKQLAEQMSLVHRQSQTSKYRNWAIVLLSLLLTIVIA